MSNIVLTFTDASLAVLQAVLIECSVQREHMGTNLAHGPAFAPQVHCSGSRDGEMIYNIVTPTLHLSAARCVLAAADRAESSVTL